MGGHAEIVVALAEAGADVNECNTILHIASQRGNAEVVSALMACNVSLTVKNSEGQLPIDVAANDEIRQRVNEEMTARFDHGLKRAVISHPPPAPAVDCDAANAVNPVGDNGVDSAGAVSSSHATAAAAAAASVASEDEDSEESSDEDR